jgi:CRP/FNR family transcriptional regulator, cyclic AMP receptor protein
MLAQIPLFESLSETDLEALGERLTERRYGAREQVFARGSSGSSMYIVLSGAAQIVIDSDDGKAKANATSSSSSSSSGQSASASRVIVKEVRAGEYFGELALFDDKPRSASVEASMPTVLLELTRDVFVDHLGKSPAAAIAVLSEMASRLRETNSLLSQRAAKDVVKEIEENLSFGQRLADKVADLNGSWAFIGFLLGLSVLWAVLNTVSPHPFDVYPYVFFNLLLAILVSLQGPLIVMSQNRQTLKDRAQAEMDFRVNLKNEVNIENIKTELSAFRAETEKHLDVLERAARAERLRQEMPLKKVGGPLDL